MGYRARSPGLYRPEYVTFEKIEGENNVYTVFDEIATHEVIVAKMKIIKNSVEAGVTDAQYLATILEFDLEYVKEAIAIYSSDDE
jgi:hypothetical protein